MKIFKKDKSKKEIRSVYLSPEQINFIQESDITGRGSFTSGIHQILFNQGFRNSKKRRIIDQEK